MPWTRDNLRMSTVDIFKITACLTLAVILSSLTLCLTILALLNGATVAALMVLLIAGAPACFMWSASYSITYYARGK